MMTANRVSRTTEALFFEWIITAEIAAASMAVTASVRIRVPRGSPRCAARSSACRTTHKAAPMMTANSQTEITTWRTSPEFSGYRFPPATRYRRAVTMLTPSHHSLRIIEDALGGTLARSKDDAQA